MNFKRILVLVLALVVIVSACSPAIHAAAASINHEQDKSATEKPKKEIINYVSLGDVMANGFGLGVATGFQELSSESYPAKFAAWLAGVSDPAQYNQNSVYFEYKGSNGTVSLMQLATQNVRPEDLLWALTVDSGEIFENGLSSLENAPDAWTLDNLLNNGGWSHSAIDTDIWAGYVAATYQSAIKDADIISLGLGNTNFDAFLKDRLMPLISMGTEEELQYELANYSYMTLENALELCNGLAGNASELINNLYDKAMSVFSRVGLPASGTLELVCGRVAYVAASYMASYEELIDVIVEINPDVEIILVPMVNNMANFELDVVYNGTEIKLNLGDVFGALCDAMNAHVAGVPAVKQYEGEYENAKFYYAELPSDENGNTIKVETSAGDLDIFDERLINAVQSFILPLIFGNAVNGVDFNGLFDAEDVKHFQEYVESYENQIENYRIVKEKALAAKEKYENAQAAFDDAYNEFGSNTDPDKYQELLEKLEKASEELAAAIAEATEAKNEFDVTALILGNILDYFLGNLDDDNSFELSINGDLSISKCHMVAFYIAIAEVVIDATKEIPTLDLDNLLKNGIASVDFDLSGLIAIALDEDMLMEVGELLILTHNDIYNSDLTAAGLDAAAITIAMNAPDVVGEELSKIEVLTSVLSVYGKLLFSEVPTAEGHDTLADSLINAYDGEYMVQDETIKNIEEYIDLIIYLVGEYYDEAYELAYYAADYKQYTTKAVNVINRVINRLERVDLSDNTMTAAFRSDLQTEIDALVATLVEIREAIANDDMKNVEGLIATLYALNDDVLTHVDNINALCEQFGIDLNNKVILPALDEALEIITTEVIPSVEAFVNAFVDAFVAHVTEKAAELYVAAYGIAEELYLELVAFVTKVALYVGPRAEVLAGILGRQFTVLLDILAEIRGNLNVAFAEALKIYEDLMEKALEIKGEIDKALEFAATVYPVLLENLYKVLGDVDMSIDMASKVIKHAIYRVADVVVDINDIAVLTNDIVTIVYEILVDAGLPVDEAIELAVKVCDAVLGMYLDEIGAESVLDIVDGLLDEVYTLLLDSGLTIKEAAVLAATTLGSALVTVVKHFDDIDNALDFTKGVLQNIYDFLVENKVEITEAIKTTIESCVAFVANIPVELQNALDELLKGIFDAAYELLLDAGLVAEEAIKVMMGICYEVLVKLANDGCVALEQLVEAALRAAYELLLKAGVAVEEALGKALEACYEMLVKLGHEAEELLADIAKGMLNAAYDILVEAGMAAKDALAKALETCYSVLLKLADEAKVALAVFAAGLLAAAYNHIIEAGLSLHENLVNITNDILATVYNYLVSTGMSVAEALESVVAMAKQTVKFVIESVENVKAALEIAGKVIKTVYDFLVENGADIEEALKITANIVKEVVVFVIENADDIKAAVEVIVEVYKTVLELVMEYGDDVVAVLEVANDAFVTVYEFLAEYGDDIVHAFEVASRVYIELVDFVIENQEEIELAFEIAGEAFEFMLECAEWVYENREDIYTVATKVYAELLKTIDRVYVLADYVKELYDYVVDVLTEVFGSIENAMLVAEKVYNRLVKLLVQYKNDLDALALEAYAVYQDILDIIMETYGATKDAICTAKKVYLHILGTLYAWNEELQDMVAGATNGSYELTEDSYYVALGNSKYGQELANMLNLANKFAQFTVDEDFAEAVAGADLITIKVNNGEFYSFAYTQIMGTLADIVRSNEHLVGWMDNSLVGDQIRAEIESFGIDLDAHVEELEWSKYLTAEDIELLDMFLARVKVELLEMGIPETFEIDVTAEIADILRAEGLLLPGVELAIDPVVIRVADLAIYGIENLLYSYVQFVERTAVLLENVRELSPEATIVITHVANPLELLPFDISSLVPEFDEYAKVLDGAIDALNLYLYGLAMVNENTIFVDSENAEDIYGALNVFCNHKYDDCEDNTCNICAETRKAPGHSYTQWIYNNDHTCTKDGTTTAKCDNCDSVKTVTKKGSAIGHKWENATCTTPKHCLNCGEVSGKALGHIYDNSCDTDCNRCGNYRSITHTFGEWEITIHPTPFKAGEQTRTCSVCGYTETQSYEIEPEFDFVTLVALALGSIVVAFGASTVIILLIQKKREG